MKTVISLTLGAAVALAASGSLSPAIAGGSAASKLIGKFVSATVADSVATSHGLFGKKKKKNGNSEGSNTGTNTGTNTGGGSNGGNNNDPGGLSFQEAFRQGQGKTTTEEVSGEQQRMNTYAESILNGNTGRVVSDDYCDQPGVNC